MPVVTIMVVEDSNIVRSVICNKIKQFTGVEVVSFEHGKDAVDEYLNNKQLRLIFTDIRMPVMGGEALAATIRTHEIYNGRDRIPIIAISDYNDDYTVEKSEAAGIDGRLPKPVTDYAMKELLSRYGYEIISS